MRLPLPDSVRSKLRPTPQWLAISLPPAEQVVTLTLGISGLEFDVTHNIAVAALRPFTLRLGMDFAMAAAVRRTPQPSLRLIDAELQRTIGVMRLEHSRDWAAAGACIGLFTIREAQHRCTPRARRAWDTWMYARAVRNVPRESLLMLPDAVEQMLVFYLRPRPVCLVSVDDGEHSNIFPMDLIGPLPPDRFTLALRNTSPSVATIKAARRIAVADLPGTACRIAYQLGAHHKRAQVDWDSLPFPTLRSREFDLPVPAMAPRIREIEILAFQTIGSHTLFVGCVRSEIINGESTERLCHTSGAHQRLRIRCNRPFHEALTGEPH
ncbi:MAG TPA: hypothetical protein VHB68_03775 [Steroidobacteraceae bacterium]|nr:hypothetical protein [Steroidobacteraceae bacterium]